MQDNCDIRDCSWYETTSHYSELGKGICYKEDYSETDKCSLCSSSNPFFSNVDCTPQICERLGACIPTGGGCGQCEATTKCSDYATEYECNKEQNNFDFIGQPESCKSSSEFSYTDDSCNLGRCRWTGSACIKDANNDNSPDIGCLLYTSPSPRDRS